MPKKTEKQIENFIYKKILKQEKKTRKRVLRILRNVSKQKTYERKAR